MAPRLGAQSEVSPILLDLIVRDKKNAPVGDLRAEEVEVYEGGLKQTFEGFRRVGMPAAPAGAPAAAAPDTGRLVVLLFPRLSATKAAGEHRTLEVKVAREGAKVQARRQYLVGEVAAALVPAFEKRLADALVADHPADAVEVWSRPLHYAWDGKEQTQVLWLSVPLAKVSLAETTPPGKFEGAVSILSRVKDASGKVVATYSQRIPLVGPADQLGRARGQSLPFVRRVKLGPGEYTLETAVRDERADTLTVRRTPLKVQAPQGLSISSLSLGELLPAGSGSDPDDPLRLGNQRLIPNLGQPIKAGQAAMTLHSVVYTPTGSKEAANMTITLSLDGQAVNRASAVLPAPDAGGWIPYASAPCGWTCSPREATASTWRSPRARVAPRRAWPSRSRPDRLHGPGRDGPGRVVAGPLS